MGRVYTWLSRDSAAQGTGYAQYTTELRAACCGGIFDERLFLAFIGLFMSYCISIATFEVLLRYNLLESHHALRASKACLLACGLIICMHKTAQLVIT